MDNIIINLASIYRKPESTRLQNRNVADGNTIFTLFYAAYLPMSDRLTRGLSPNLQMQSPFTGP